MKKGLVVLGIMMIAIPCMAATMTLPPVELDTSTDSGTGDYLCPAWGNMSEQGQNLLTILKPFVTGLPTFDTADLENAIAGDGIPDKYQLGLLSAVLCAGNAEVQDQFDANKATYTDLVADIQTLLALLVGNSTATPAVDPLATRLANAVTLLTAAYPTPSTELADVIAEIGDADNGLIKTLNGFVDDIGSYTSALSLLNNYADVVAGLAGLDSELIGSLTSMLTPDMIADVEDIRDQVTTAAGVVSTYNTNPPLDAAGVATISGLVTDANSIVAIVNSALTLIQSTTPFVIYGVTTSAKSAAEPFSALGDYDQDGVTNLVTYQALAGSSKATVNVEEFVAAASGANPFYKGNPLLPVTSLFGLAAMASACLAGGAFTLRKK